MELYTDSIVDLKMCPFCFLHQKWSPPTPKIGHANYEVFHDHEVHTSTFKSNGNLHCHNCWVVGFLTPCFLSLSGDDALQIVSMGKSFGSGLCQLSGLETLLMINLSRLVDNRGSALFMAIPCLWFVKVASCTLTSLVNLLMRTFRLIPLFISLILTNGIPLS